MPNLLEFLRQQNIFGAPPIGGNMSLPPPATPLPQSFNIQGMGAADSNVMGAMGAGAMPSPQYDVASRMREMYQPTNDASQKLNDLISQYPQEQNPSILRRIAAMLIDYTKGHQAGQTFFNEPQQKAITDWKNKIGPVEQAANLERYENVNQRTQAYQTISEELRLKAQEAKDKNDTRNAEIRQQRADIYAFKATNPNLKFIMSKGGNVTAINPLTGESHDTGVPTGSLTELAKMNLQNEQRLGQIGAQGANAQTLENMKQTGREGIAETRGWQIYNIPDKDNPGQQKAVKINAITGEVKDINAGPVSKPTTGAGGRGELPTQTRIRQFTKAREIVNSRPDLAKFIKLGSPGANDFTITAPGENFFGSTGPTQQQYNEVQQLIYGGAPIASHEPTGSGTIRVKNKQGQTGTFKGTAAEARAAGYTVIEQ
jgi:hypothetical protein